MNVLVVDSDFVGLVKRENTYRYDGNLVAPENLEIRLDLPLFVTRYIRAKGYIKSQSCINSENSIIAGDSIRSKGGILAGGPIKAGGYIKAGDFIESGGVIVAKSVTAGYCIYSCKGVTAKWVKMFSVKSKSVHSILSGFKYSISAWGGQIKIGCVIHSKEDWENFTDEEIEAMDEGSAKLWNTHKKMILAIPNEKWEGKR